MPVEFRCTGCNKLLRTAQDTAGKQARCPECGAPVTVPVPEAGPPGETRPQPSAPPPPAAEPGSPFAPAGGEPAASGDPENPYQAPTQYSPPPAHVPSGRTDPKAVASLVLGLCGFLLFCCCAPLAFPVALTGLILGITGRESDNRGLAIAGIILCAIQLALFVAYIAVLVFVGIADGPQGPFNW